MQFLDQIDRALFTFINMSLANPVTDFLMPIITSDNLLRAAYGIMILLILIKGSCKWKWAVFYSAIILLLTDQMVAGLLKPIIARARPCQIFGEINLLVNCGAGMSMPSAHAGNAFGQALFFSLINKKLRPYLLTAAGLISLSRVFVGVHYPGDIIAGALIGSLIGWGVFLLSQKMGRSWGNENSCEN